MVVSYHNYSTKQTPIIWEVCFSLYKHDDFASRELLQDHQRLTPCTAAGSPKPA
ncbi:hypothetical protein KNP414_06187 [Paenibacillus mucilaginosus KNP414]|uniref:Uncharacterized protein n=1 Tax=Paenibacillus mucilaginosus (strain KNP414) TaxID=1036673 RepID=F8FIG7_PAEMK|nr:hypothetical protein KNP414_06187 [Paenibacillus mucilaginosus KNP414]